jgi:lysylphosphatidylglycerol synthetase-like protein (DUF2156 family)
MKQLFLTVTLVSTMLVGGLFFAPSQAFASNHCDAGSAGFLGLPTWYKYLEVGGGDCSVTLPQRDGTVDIGATVGAILFAVIEILLRIAGIVAIGFVIYGGILYSMSQGVPDRLQAAQKTILNGVIGIVIAVFAVAIVNLITNIVIG